MKKTKKFLLILFSVFLISTLSICTFIGNLLYNIIISSSSSKDTIYADYSFKASYYYENWLTNTSNSKDEYNIFASLNSFVFSLPSAFIILYLISGILNNNF